MPAYAIVRRANAGDVDAMRWIEQACAEAPHWSKAVWMQVPVGTEGRETARAGFVAEHIGSAVGFAVVSCACGVAALESVAVVPDARRNGAGRALCIATMEWAREQSAAAIELEVRASSLGAVSMYGSLGFKEQGRRRGYYRDPIDDALLMSAPLPAKG